MKQQPELIMASVTKALALMSVSATSTNANGHNLAIEDKKPPEHNQQVAWKNNRGGNYDTTVRRTKCRATYKRNFLGLLTYH